MEMIPSPWLDFLRGVFLANHLASNDKMCTMIQVVPNYRRTVNHTVPQSYWHKISSNDCNCWHWQRSKMLLKINHFFHVPYTTNSENCPQLSWVILLTERYRQDKPTQPNNLLLYTVKFRHLLCQISYCGLIGWLGDRNTYLVTIGSD